MQGPDKASVPNPKVASPANSGFQATSELPFRCGLVQKLPHQASGPRELLNHHTRIIDLRVSFQIRNSLTVAAMFCEFRIWDTRSGASSIRKRSISTELPPFTGSPAFAGDDAENGARALPAGALWHCPTPT